MSKHHFLNFRLLLPLVGLLLSTVSFGQNFKIKHSPDGYSKSNAGYIFTLGKYDSLAYLRYRTDAFNNTMFIYDGANLTPVPSPKGYDSVSGAGFWGNIEFFDDGVYCRYQHNDGHFDLLVYDADTFRHIPNPRGYTSRGYWAKAVELGTKKYLYFSGSTNHVRPFRLIGDSLHPVYGTSSGYFRSAMVYDSMVFFENRESNRDIYKMVNDTMTRLKKPAGFDKTYSGYYEERVEYQNNFYCRYRSNTGNYSLAKFDTDSFAPIASPPNYTAHIHGGFYEDPIVVDSILYLNYLRDDSSYHLMKYNGSALTEITSPPAYVGKYRGNYGDHATDGKTLYMKFRGTDDNYDLAKYVNDSLIIIPSPKGYDDADRGYERLLLIDGNTLYLKYYGNDGNYDLFTYDGSTLKAIPSPEGFSKSGKGLDRHAIKVNCTIFFRYVGDDNNADLFQYDGKRLTQFPSPKGFQGAGFGYFGYPWEFKDQLLMVYRGDDRNYDLAVLKDIGFHLDDSLTACDSITWMDGLTYYASNDSASYFSNSPGCDTIHHLKLDLNYSTFSRDSITACDQFTWIDNQTYFRDTLGVSHILANQHGCDSIVTLDLTINKVTDLTVTRTGDTLVVANENGTYQWLDCADNFNEISGETKRLTRVNSPGSFAVEVTENGCIDTSECLDISVLNLNKMWSQEGLTVFPNPTYGEVNIRFNSPRKLIKMDLFSPIGQHLLSREIMGSDMIQLNLPETGGTYFLEVSTEHGERHMIRIIKL
jgi:hypothetical protein